MYFIIDYLFFIAFVYLLFSTTNLIKTDIHNLLCYLLDEFKILILLYNKTSLTKKERDVLSISLCIYLIYSILFIYSSFLNKYPHTILNIVLYIEKNILNILHICLKRFLNTFQLLFLYKILRDCMILSLYNLSELHL